MNADVQLIIVAGGMGTRLGHALPKALVPLADTPLLVHTIMAFQECELAHTAIIVHPAGYGDTFSEQLDTAFPGHRMTLIEGGQEREDSVANGLAALSPTSSIVAIHDAARPFIENQTILSAIDTARDYGASTVACACKDTVLQVNEALQLSSTPDRSSLRMCQTPQVFQRTIIEQAYKKTADGPITDDATRVQQLGHSVVVVEGSDKNIKITTPQDIEYAEFLLAKGLI